jgi:hypothetical protein
MSVICLNKREYAAVASCIADHGGGRSEIVLIRDPHLRVRLERSDGSRAINFRIGWNGSTNRETS